jgi:hypothetical protein
MDKKDSPYTLLGLTLLLISFLYAQKWSSYDSADRTHLDKDSGDLWWVVVNIVKQLWVSYRGFPDY